MPGLSLAPVNLAAGVVQNPLAQIGAALAALPQQQQQAQLQNQVVGKQLMQPFLNMIKANADYMNDPSVMNPLNAISKKYGIPIPYGPDESPDSPANVTQSTGQPTPQAAPTGPTPAPGVTPTKPLPPGPGAAMSIGGPASAPPGGVATPPVPGVVPGAQPTPGSPAFQPPQQSQPQSPMVSQTTGAPIPGAPQPAQQPTPVQPQMPDHTTPGGRRIAASFVGATLDPQTVLTLQQMQPDQRKAYLEATGVDPRWVPKSLLTEPVVMDPTAKAKVLGQLNTDFTRLINSGNLSVGAVQAMVGGYQAEGLLDKAGADAYLNNEQTLTQLGQGERTKLALLLRAGTINEQKYNLAVDKLKAYEKGQISISDYRKWEEQFIGFKEMYMTASQAQTQERINNQTTEFARTADQRDTLLEQGQDRLDHSDYTTLVQQTKSAEANYENLQSIALQNQGSDFTKKTGPPGPDGQPTGDSFADTMAAAKALKTKLEGQLHAANNGYRNPNSALSKNGIQTTDGSKGSRYGSPVAKDGQGKLVYKSGNSYVYADGSPYKPTPQ